MSKDIPRFRARAVINEDDLVRTAHTCCGALHQFRQRVRRLIHGNDDGDTPCFPGEHARNATNEAMEGGPRHIDCVRGILMSWLDDSQYSQPGTRRHVPFRRLLHVALFLIVSVHIP